MLISISCSPSITNYFIILFISAICVLALEVSRPFILCVTLLLLLFEYFQFGFKVNWLILGINLWWLMFNLCFNLWLFYDLLVFIRLRSQELSVWLILNRLYLFWIADIFICVFYFLTWNWARLIRLSFLSFDLLLWSAPLITMTQCAVLSRLILFCLCLRLWLIWFIFIEIFYILTE